MRILVVDDSVVYRSAIKMALTSSNTDYEVDVAANGKIAIEKIKAKSYDVMTLDLEMPVMDGIETIQAVREFNKTLPIIIFSAQNLEAAHKTLKALELGANDFIQKIEGTQNINENLSMINRELIPRFNALTKKFNTKKTIETTLSTSETSPVFRERGFLELSGFRPELICIASSTGGPDALKSIFSALKKLPIPIVMVQHMPPIFTTQLAKNLNEISEMEVQEVQGGEILQPGHAYLAPGDFHMVVNKGAQGLQLELNQDEKVCFVRPAADVLFKSVANCFNGKILGVVLTGMGSDGAEGCKALKNRNSRVLIQDEASSVVWGMPKAVYDTKCHDIRLDLASMADLINRMACK